MNESDDVDAQIRLVKKKFQFKWLTKQERDILHNEKESVRKENNVFQYILWLFIIHKWHQLILKCSFNNTNNYMVYGELGNHCQNQNILFLVTLH